jgi:hypothetical protein
MGSWLDVGAGGRGGNEVFGQAGCRWSIDIHDYRATLFESRRNVGFGSLCGVKLCTSREEERFAEGKGAEGKFATA